MDKIINPNQFNHFKEIPCDKCGSVVMYDPCVVADVTECFGCLCKKYPDGYGVPK